jgi:hypothetical protein
MKRFLCVAALLLMPVGVAHGETPSIRCPGNNTYEMQNCAGKSQEQSGSLLKQKITMRNYRQWSKAARAVCEAAYPSSKGGTIIPQLFAGCVDHLNRALLKEFQPLGN